MDVEIEEEEYGRRQLTNTEQYAALAADAERRAKDGAAWHLTSLVKEHRRDRSSSKLAATIMNANGDVRSVTIKQHKKDTNGRFRRLLDDLAEGERIVALRRVEVTEWYATDIPPDALKRRIIETKQRERRRRGHRERSQHKRITAGAIEPHE